MHNLKVTISARLFNKHGKLIRTYRPRAAHSFLAQFIELLKVQMSQVATNITRTAGTEHSIPPGSVNLDVSFGASNLTAGILIGNGTTPVDIDDYALESQITTNLTVSAHTFVLSYPTATSRRLTISRTFTNGTASPMPIEEVALYCDTSQAYLFMIDRTLYSVGIPASSSLELTYRITVSV